MGSIIKYVSKRFPRLKEGNKIYKSRDEIMISLQHFTNLPREIREINKRGWEPNKLRGSAKIRKRKNAPPVYSEPESKSQFSYEISYFGSFRENGECYVVLASVIAKRFVCHLYPCRFTCSWCLISTIF